MALGRSARALEFAEFNAALNGVENVEFVRQLLELGNVVPAES